MSSDPVVPPVPPAGAANTTNTTEPSDRKAVEPADVAGIAGASGGSGSGVPEAPGVSGGVAGAGVSDESARNRDRAAQLAKVPFFDGLTPEALAMIAEVTTEEAHAYGTRIFQYGDPGDKLYIILEGKVRISREVGGMGEEALAVLGSGEVFGEMALLDESPRSASALAHERCRLLIITKDAFDDLLFLHKDLAYEVLWSCVRMLAARLRETNDKLTFLSTSGRF